MTTSPIPKLILVDGFAGAGKSTSAQQLWLNLARAGRDAAWIHEHQAAHPIFQYGEPEELLQLSPGPFEERLLAGWNACAKTARRRGTRFIEGSFLQIPAGVMLAMNVPAARIRALLRRIDAIAAGCDASLVYLFRSDLRDALHRIGDERGGQWLESMTAALAQSAYGRAHRVRSLDGLVTFYDRQRAIVDAVFPTLTVRRLAIDVSGDRWDHYERQMAAFAGISRVPAVPLRPSALLRHTGGYRGATTGLPCVITTDGASLYMQMPATRAVPLVRVTGGHFCLRSLPIDIRFAYNRKGEARRFDYESRMVNEVLSDTSWIRA